jgi:hypothetical protein
VLYYQSADRQNDDQWEIGQRELEMYLAFRYGNYVGMAPVYGVLGIGVKVKIFKYDGGSCCIEWFVPPWDLERHHELVWEGLRGISRAHTGGGGKEGVNGCSQKD